MQLIGLFLLTCCIGTLGFLLLLIDPTTKLSPLNLAIFTFVGIPAWLAFMILTDRLSRVFPAFQEYSNAMLVAHISTIAIAGRLAVFAVHCLKSTQTDLGTGFSRHEERPDPREI